MPPLAFQSGSRLAPGPLRIGLLAAALLVLSGCQGLGGSSFAARVRIIDLSPDTTAVDIYQGANAVAYNLSFGTVTSYVPITAGAQTITVDTAGSRQVLSTLHESFSASAHYTILLNNGAASLQPLVLQDQPQLTATSAPTLRIVNQAARFGAVDVYLVPTGKRLISASPIASGLAYGVSTSYLGVPTGIAAVVLVPAGTVLSGETVPAHTGTQLHYGSGSARTLILTDPQQTISPGLQVITTTDAEPVS